MDPLTIGFLTAIFGAIGSIASGGFKAAATNRATQSAAQSKKDELDWERESAQWSWEGQEEENRRRTAEAQHRAAKLEDVAKMFEGLQGYGEEGDIAGLRGLADQMGAMDLSGMDQFVQMLGDTGGLDDIIGKLMGKDDSADLRKAAMRTLDRDSGALNAMLAQSGVRGSGFAAGQQRGLVGDTMMGLADKIAANRSQNLGMAGSMFGQRANQLGLAGNMLGTKFGLQQSGLGLQGDFLSRAMQGAQGMKDFDMRQLENISRLFQDDSFGVNLDYTSPTPPWKL